MGKKEKTEDADQTLEIKEENEMSYEDKLLFVNSIAKPMAPKKLTKKCYKLIKKASKQKTYLRTGLKNVQRFLRRGETGIVICAGDVQPIDIMCHIPGVCEEKNIPYCYTPSRQDIGSALGFKRTLLVALVKEHDDYKDLFDECKGEIKTLPTPL